MPEHPRVEERIFLPQGAEPNGDTRTENANTTNDIPDNVVSKAALDAHKVDVYEHRAKVQQLLGKIMTNILNRLMEHDKTKLHEPESETFARFPKRPAYGTKEYAARLLLMRAAIQHHWAHNRHHPEHHENGIAGMSLIDLLEMLCDWMAASLQHPEGDIRDSIVVNQQRFGYSDEVRQLLLNTLEEIEEKGR